MCGEDWFAPGQCACRQRERRPTAARAARVPDRCGAGKVRTRPTSVGANCPFSLHRAALDRAQLDLPVITFPAISPADRN